MIIPQTMDLPLRKFFVWDLHCAMETI